MATFNFPYHKQSTKYPESGKRMQMGNSYMSAAEPSGPDQRVFMLDFATMKYFLVAGVISPTFKPEINLAALEAFYKEHRLWKTFIYPHPVYGNVNVKFNKPLEIPKGISDGDGAVEAFSVELIEQP